MTEAQKLLKRFADSARSGAQGVTVDCDTAQALAQAIDHVLGDFSHKYPDRHPPGTHWSTDEAWEILDTIKPGLIPPDVRAWIAGAIAGRLMKEREDRLKGMN